MINKKQTFEILSLIQNFYEHFEITQAKIDSWLLILKDSEFETVKENLLQYCRVNKFPPKVADLLNEKAKTVDRMNAIPNADETRAYLESFNNEQELTAEQRQQIENEKAKIRRILGIG